MGNGPRMSIGMDTVARLEEMQQLIHRLKEENKNLKKQVQDAQEESWFNNLRDGQKLLTDTDSTLDAEMDRLTKEEVISHWWILLPPISAPFSKPLSIVILQYRRVFGNVELMWGKLCRKPKNEFYSKRT